MLDAEFDKVLLAVQRDEREFARALEEDCIQSAGVTAHRVFDNCRNGMEVSH